MEQSEQQRVKRGATVMDRLLPGWHKYVDLNKLNMGDGSMCLLGQTFGLHAERCLAKEMYPEEWEAAVTETKARVKNEAREEQIKTWGYTLASPGYGDILAKIARKRYDRIKKNKIDRIESDLQVLQRVCAGYDNKCYWAEEITDRLVKDGDKEV